MLVRTQSVGREVTGLYIGSRNARRFFPKEIAGIELQLGHLHIHCELGPSFWTDQPEISDSRLGDWLIAKIFHGKTGRAPVPVAMIPLGKNAFSVQPVSLPYVSTNGLSRIGPVTPPVPSLERKALARSRTQIPPPT